MRRIRSSEGFSTALWKPNLLALTTSLLTLLAFDMLDSLTAMYGWTIEAGEIYGWHVPSLYMVFRVLSASVVMVAAAPISFVARMQRELSLGVQKILVCRGTSFQRLILNLFGAAIAHALVFWGIHAVVCLAVAQIACTGEYGAAYLTSLHQAGAPVLPEQGFLIPLALVVSTALPSVTLTVAALCCYLKSERLSLSISIVPALYLMSMACGFLPALDSRLAALSDAARFIVEALIYAGVDLSSGVAAMASVCAHMLLSLVVIALLMFISLCTSTYVRRGRGHVRHLGNAL